MAVIMKDDQEQEIADESPIRDACDALGVMFGCRSGFCGTCNITILEGEDNLTEMNDAEKNMGLEQGHRLACQAIIKKGFIKIKQY